MKAPHVSDHAIVRYLERVMGMGPEIAAVRERIASEVAGAVAIGATSLSRNGISYALRGAVVVTVGMADSPSAFAANGFIANGDNSHRTKSPKTTADIHRNLRRIRKLNGRQHQRPEGRG